MRIALLIAIGFATGTSTTVSCAQGLLPEDPAVLSTLPQVPVHRAWLPPSVDLSADFPPPGNQGSIGSCTGWAVGYALRSYIEHEAKGVDLSELGNRFNPLFVYNHVSQSCSSGAVLSSALGFLSTVGALPFRELASINCPDDAGPDAMARAITYRIGGYRVLAGKRPDDIKGELVHRRPVVFGIRDTQALHRLGPDEIYTQPSTETLGGHAMVVVGYDDARQAFKVMNSWGPGWGSGGFGWIDYNVFDQEIQVALSAEPSASHEPTPKPPPAPTPAIVVLPPAPEPFDGLRARIHALAASVPCSRLDVSAAGHVIGFVGSAADAKRVREAGSGAPTDGVALRPWPQCEALLTLEQPIARPAGLSLALAAPENHCSGNTLCGGDALIATVHMPHRSAYLYLAYIQAAGATIILEQPISKVSTPHRPAEVIVLGKALTQTKWHIAPPFGREMVIALASASPLFDNRLPDEMTEREFLTMLRKALLYKPRPSDPDRLVSAAVLPITTGSQ